MTVEDRSEIILTRRVARQPSPNLNPQGDCGPCVVSAVLGLSGPQAVYDRFHDSKPYAISFHDMQGILRVEDGKLLDRVIEYAPTWLGAGAEFSGWLGTYGWHAERFHEPWFNYARMAFDAGYYGLAQVDYSRTGGEKYGGPDHWVLLCGARSWVEWGDEKDGCRAGIPVRQILVSCSASNVDGEWVDARDMLKFRGGFNAFFARPRTP